MKMNTSAHEEAGADAEAEVGAEREELNEEAHEGSVYRKKE